ATLRSRPQAPPVTQECATTGRLPLNGLCWIRTTGTFCCEWLKRWDERRESNPRLPAWEIESSIENTNFRVYGSVGKVKIGEIIRAHQPTELLGQHPWISGDLI